MLSYANRLKKNREYQYIMRKGKRYSGKCFSAFVVSTYMKYPKVGIVVSKKVGNSVTRSLIKRRLSHAMRSIIADCKPCNIVLVASAVITQADFFTIQRELRAMMISAGIICE